MNKKITAIGLSAGLIAGLGAGLALEMSGNAGASNGRSVMVGSNQNSSDPQGMPGGFDQRLQDILKPLVDDGTITQAQADKVIGALQAAGPMGGGRDGGRDGGFGGDRHGDHGPGGRGMGPGAHLDTVASVLGISVDDVRSAVKGGSTIADLAKKHGKTGQDVIDALVAEVKAHFAPEVASGEHTQADADARIADATKRITDFVNNTTAAVADGHMGPDDGMGGGMNGGDPNGGGNGGMMGGTIDGGPKDTVAP